MPSALSEYDSLSDRDETPSRSRRGSSPPSRKRQRRGLLNGLDAGNIILSDETTVSSAEDDTPTSSYMTRGSARGARSSDLAYDQKYHPMDDYLRPSQATKRRAEHGLDYNSSVDSVESDTGGEDQSQVKKRKLCKFVTQRGTRRSSRKTNYNVLYDMHIHPQDSQLEQMANTGDEAVEENDEVISVESSGAAEEEGVPVARDTTDVASHLTISSRPPSTPLSTASINKEAQQSVLSHNSHVDHHEIRSSASPRMESTPFAIHEEPFHTQLTMKAASPAPLDYEHDNVTNGDKSPNIIEQYLDSAMFDGPSDQLSVIDPIDE